MTTIEVSEASKIEEVDREVHDRWFDIEAVEYREGEKALVFRLGVVDDGVVVANREMVVFDVQSYQLSDDEGIGIYDVNRIDYDAKAGVLRVITNIPTKVAVNVTSLRVSVGMI